MKIDQVGEVGVVLTDANEPVLHGGDQIIGYRALKYTIFKPVSLAKKTLVEQREGWVWQTRRRLLLLDMEWLDLPGGKKGKHYHEIPLEETIDVVHKRKRVLLETKDKEHGKVVFEFRPFGAASRLLAWLKNEKEHRRADRPEFEDDLAVFLVLRFQEHTFPLVDHVDRLLERNLVVVFPFLTSREVEPFHVEEEEPPPGLPHPSLPLFDERLLRQGHGFEDGVLQGAVPDDLIAAGEDGFVRIREDDPNLTDLIDLHPTCRTPGAG